MDGIAGHAITKAISEGVPKFNNGDALGCFNVYREVSTALVRTPQALPHGAAARLQAALDGSTSGSAQDRAWTMRHALDDVVAMLRNAREGQPPSTGGGSMRLDFADRKLQWSSVDDRVMGGSSRSRMSVGPDGALFEGMYMRLRMHTALQQLPIYPEIRSSSQIQESSWSRAAALPLCDACHHAAPST